jgi:hypothetical protein
MMRLRIVFVAAALWVVCGGCGSAQEVRNVIYVGSQNSGSGLTQDRLQACVRLLAEEMRIDESALPIILVIHVSPGEAERAGLKKAAAKLRINYDPERSTASYYELWVSGKPTTLEYTYSLSCVLEHFAGVHRSEAEEKEIVARVVRFLDATISASGK